MITANSRDIEISFDVVGVNDTDTAIIFSIHVDFSEQMQQIKYHIRNVHIDKKDLSTFEEQLDTAKVAEFTDVSGFVVLRFESNDEFTLINIQPSNSEVVTEYDCINISIKADKAMYNKLDTVFKKYPKWW